jgi:phosphatidylserine/phosphatidylglycerophosphate/cardiolipin synthase-like enzyme
MPSPLDPVHPGDTLAVRFLEGGAQRPLEVAGRFADFLGGARRSLDLAFYDVRLADAPALLLRRILAARVNAGVRVRLCYDAGDKPQGPAGQDLRGVEPAPRDTHERVAELGLPPRALRAVAGPQALMHHKYVVRDGTAVWTGSLNLSDDSLARMDNTVLTLDSPRLAAYYARDFLQLWGTGKMVASGAFPTAPDALRYAGAPAAVDVDFSPGRGRQINAWVAERVLAARRRVVLCTMLFTSSRLLRALGTVLDRGEVEVWGVYDGTQMAGVLDQWRERPDLDLAWKVAAVERVVAGAGLVGKASTPYRPGASHDFMHAKTIVVDDAVLTGSHNFSHAAQDNAENLLLIASPALADACAAFARRLATRYGPPDPTSP